MSKNSLWCGVNLKRDEISDDFRHLSQVVHSQPEESVLYHVTKILEKCLQDSSYCEEAKINLAAYSSHNQTVKKTLETIQTNDKKTFDHIQDLAKEIFSNNTPKSKL
jgi:uncharacterized protein YkuJ